MNKNKDAVTAALSDLIDSIDEVHGFVELEAGCNGEGAVVVACRTIGKPIPPNLAAWFAQNELPMDKAAKAHEASGGDPETFIEGWLAVESHQSLANGLEQYETGGREQGSFRSGFYAGNELLLAKDTDSTSKNAVPNES